VAHQERFYTLTRGLATNQLSQGQVLESFVARLALANTNNIRRIIGIGGPSWLLPC
jgi:hypothetical protein